MDRYKTYLLIGAIILVLLIVITLIISSQQIKKPAIPVTTPTPHKNITSILLPTNKPVQSNNLPLNNQGALDINSSVVVNSTQEINKIKSFLPYDQKTTLSTGLPVEISVSNTVSANNYSLLVDIFGIDYQLSSSDPNYQLMKNSFLEASNNLFIWMRSYNVDPNKVIIVWGTKKYIQDQSEKWLNGQ